MTEFFDSEPSHMWYWQRIIWVELLIGTVDLFGLYCQLLLVVLGFWVVYLYCLDRGVVLYTFILYINSSR